MAERVNSIGKKQMCVIPIQKNPGNASDYVYESKLLNSFRCCPILNGLVFGKLNFPELIYWIRLVSRTNKNI